MKTNLRLATAACATVMALGMVGCGGGNTTVAVDPDPVEVTPAYATLVEANAEVAGKVLKALDDGMNSLAIDTASMDTLLVPSTVYPAGSDSENEDFTVTSPCAYEGEYTLEVKNTHTEVESFEQTNSFVKITFDHCVHNDRLVLGEFMLRPMAASKYSYSGMRSMQHDYTSMDDVLIIKHVHNAENFVGIESDLTGKKYREVSMDLVHTMDKYESGDVRRKTKTWNGTTIEKEYDDDGILRNSETYAFIDLETKRSLLDNVKTEIIDGYEKITKVDEDGNVSEGYVYGEAFTRTKERERIGSDTITSESFDGLLGTHCLGGAVSFDTSVVWETNSSQFDMNGTDRGTTPYIGTTTINGASESTVVINFATNAANETFGTVTVDGVESDPMPRPDMSKNTDECDIRIGGCHGGGG